MVTKKNTKIKTGSKPAKKAAAKPVIKKAAPKKATTKPAVKKAAPKKAAKPAVKKAVAKKPVTKKIVAKKPATKKAVAKKPVAKKPVAKKIVAKKPAAKPAAKKVIAKKPIAKKVMTKPVAKKVAPKPVAKPIAKKVEAKPAKLAPKPVTKPGKVVAKAEPVKVEEKKFIAKPSPKFETPSPASKDDKTRYSDLELQEFRSLIQKKLQEAKQDFDLLKEALSNKDNGTDDTSPTFKLLEDGSDVLSKEETAQLASRQQKFIQSLENALIRIENKTYGICRATGKLISKARLKVVPHATLSMEAKMAQ